MDQRRRAFEEIEDLRELTKHLEERSLSALQSEVHNWRWKNFGDGPKHHPILGAMEELGELCHAILKLEQGICGDEDHIAAAKDAIGDLVIYLADYCGRVGWNLEEIVHETWGRVRRRDWKKNPERGES